MSYYQIYTWHPGHEYLCWPAIRTSFVHLEGYFARAITGGTTPVQNVQYIIIIVGVETRRREKTVSNGLEQ